MTAPAKFRLLVPRDDHPHDLRARVGYRPSRPRNHAPATCESWPKAPVWTIVGSQAGTRGGGRPQWADDDLNLPVPRSWKEREVTLFQVPTAQDFHASDVFSPMSYHPKDAACGDTVKCSSRGQLAWVEIERDGDLNRSVAERMSFYSSPSLLEYQLLRGNSRMALSWFKRYLRCSNPFSLYCSQYFKKRSECWPCGRAEIGLDYLSTYLGRYWAHDARDQGEALTAAASWTRKILDEHPIAISRTHKCLGYI